MLCISALRASARRLQASRSTLRNALGPVSALGTTEQERIRDRFTDPTLYASTRKPVDEATTLHPVSKQEWRQTIQMRQMCSGKRRTNRV